MKNIHVLPTDELSRLYVYGEKIGLSKGFQYGSDDVQNQHIYITSDEKFVRDEYVTDGISVMKASPKSVDTQGLVNRRNWRKIILTTNVKLIADGVQAIDDEFLEWFVKNPSCEEVEIKKIFTPHEITQDDFCITCDSHGCNLGDEEKYTYKIIIPSSEIWKDIPEFEGYYQVSNLGNVKSLSRTILGRGKNNALLKERLLKFSTSTNGYYQVILQKEGFKKIYKVHSLVGICFLNHKPDGTHNVVIDHINEVKTDNRLENLRLIGHRENVARSMKNNTSTYVGVSWSKNAKKWISQITIEGKTKYLGLFDNEEDANKKYLETLKNL